MQDQYCNISCAAVMIIDLGQCRIGSEVVPSSYTHVYNYFYYNVYILSQKDVTTFSKIS